MHILHIYRYILSSSGAFLAYWLTACSAWLGCSDVNSWYSEQGDATYLLIRVVILQLVMEKSFRISKLVGKTLLLVFIG